MNKELLIEDIYAKIQLAVQVNDTNVIKRIINNKKYLELTQEEIENCIFDAATFYFDLLDTQDTLINYLIFDYKIPMHKEIHHFCQNNKIYKDKFEKRAILSELNNELSPSENKIKKSTKI